LHVSGCFSLPGLSNKPRAFNAWRGALRFFSQALCLFGQALV
jgi:hypothetical protein